MTARTHRRVLRVSMPLLVLVYLGTMVLQPIQQRVSAISGSDFNAGHIIDDLVFTDANAMTVQDIQNFLNAKVGSCDNNGTGSAAPFNSSMTRAQYDASIGKNTKFTCVNQYYENTTTLANNLDGNAIPSGAISAAQIIYNAAQQYQINPQVIITTLQKEEGLVTDTWPWDSEYKTAMGYACPDTAPCNSQYYGFYNQVTSAAWQFRQYLNSPNNYNYGVGTNYILYSPGAGCGGSNVSIQNQATAALYDYTPYQPNSGALSNVTDSSSGGSDGGTCGSYGNRNFWWYYTEWFGSTFMPAYAWQPTGLTIMDEGKNSPIPTDYMHPGERLWVEVTAENLGSETWTNNGLNPINLATDLPLNGYTPFCDTTWLPVSQACNRTATLQEASVASGQVGHFDFYMAVPNQLGPHRTYFTPVAEMKSWMSNDPWFNIYVNTTGTYDWRWMYLDAYTDSSKTTPIDITHLSRGQQAYIVLHVKNASATVWSNSGAYPTRLGTSNPQDSMSPLCTNTWLSCNRPAALDQATVAPGQEGTFSFYIKAPNTLGAYRQYVRPVLEFKGWTRDDPNQIYINVTQ